MVQSVANSSQWHCAAHASTRPSRFGTQWRIQGFINGGGGGLTSGSAMSCGIRIVHSIATYGQLAT